MTLRPNLFNENEISHQDLHSLKLTNSEFTPENRPKPKRKAVIFQLSIFRGKLAVIFREDVFLIKLLKNSIVQVQKIAAKTSCHEQNIDVLHALLLMERHTGPVDR